MSNFLSLDKANVGASYEICEIQNLDDKHIKRLCELGFVCGAELKIVKKSFFNKTLLIDISYFYVSVRSEILKNIMVKECGK